MRKFSMMKKFLVVFISIVIIINVATPQVIIPKAEAGSFGGYVMYPLACLTGALAIAFQQLLNLVKFVAEAFTLTPQAEVPGWENLFLSNIVYNEVSILDANIFKLDSPNPLFTVGASTGGMKAVVQKWYGITRIMALAASLVTLVFVAIKIIISSTANEKAKYRILLKDWLLSIIFIFLLHYFMAAIMFAGDILTDFFAGQSTFSYTKIIKNTFKFGEEDNLIWSATLIVFLVCTFSMLIIYLKRLILICFFITISPLVVTLHTIEKLRKGKSTVFSAWLEEFLANVVMQPVDALLVSIILNAVNDCANNGQPLIAIAFVLGFFPLRKWMMQFLGQKSNLNKQETANTLATAGGLLVAEKTLGNRVEGVSQAREALSKMK